MKNNHRKSNGIFGAIHARTRAIWGLTYGAFSDTNAQARTRVMGSQDGGFLEAPTRARILFDGKR